MCLQCSAKAECVLIENTPLEEFLPDYTLMIATETDEIWGEYWSKGEIGLVKMNNPDCVGKFTVSEKLIGLKYNDFIDTRIREGVVLEMGFYGVAPLVGYKMILAAKEVGYNPKKHGLFELWFSHRLHRYFKYFTDKAKSELLQ